jgi:hypothetical protein
MLDFNSNDRPTEEGLAVYKIVGSVLTEERELTCSIGPSSVTAEQVWENGDRTLTEPVELDSSVRVKLDSDQPDYVPAISSELDSVKSIVETIDTNVSAIDNRLPSDPADQSAVEAAITAATSGLATQASVDNIPTVAQFEARTLEASAYFDPSTDSVNVSSLTAAAVEDIFSTYTITESYAADGVEGTPAQMLYLMQQAFTEFNINGAIMTIKKLDGSSTAAVFTMNSVLQPTARTRTT